MTKDELSQYRDSLAGRSVDELNAINEELESYRQDVLARMNVLKLVRHDAIRAETQAARSGSAIHAKAGTVNLSANARQL